MCIREEREYNMDLDKILETCKDNIIISDMFTKANQVINNMGHNNIACFVSGGADSDVMIDAITKIDFDRKVKFIWFNTGLEYQATKNHLDYLENRYNVEIIRERALKPIPMCVKEYGQPFLSKFVSENIRRLQKYNFKWEDKSYEELCEEYPKCNSAIQWWCNARDTGDFGFSFLNIDYNKYLKEFLIENPPTFKVSNLCCDWAKKKVSKHYVKANKVDCILLGVRKAEGGIRQSAFKQCYETDQHGIANYRPLLWFTNMDKHLYNLKYDIVNSECYTKWGFTRTGCCGCPYAPKFMAELKTMQKYEPQMYKAVNNIFKDSYEYTKKYREFCVRKKNEAKGQILLF